MMWERWTLSLNFDWKANLTHVLLIAMSMWPLPIPIGVILLSCPLHNLVNMHSPMDMHQLMEDKSPVSVDSSLSKATSTPSTRVFQHVLPFSNWHKRKKVRPYVDQIRELFCKVELNIPLLDVIQQVPPYAKFFKELYTTKWANPCTQESLLGCKYEFYNLKSNAL